MTNPTQPTTPPVIFVLRISRGSFETGFAATLEVIQAGQVTPPQKYTLPACPNLPTDYKSWQATYTQLSQPAQTSPDPTSEPPTNLCKKATLSFEDHCLDWFSQPTFEALRRSILASVQLHQLQQVSISLEVSTHEPEQNDLLRKLPWHIWPLFEEDLRRSELTLNSLVTPTSQPFTAPLRILAVFGSQDHTPQASSTQLSKNQAQATTLKNELATLEANLSRKGARLSVLNQPSARKLQETLRKQSWDMLFFSGHNEHSPNNPGGVIHLKDNVVLTLRDLKASLNTAVENGLKLAIFNAHDGLDLANYLAARKVPISIVMREPVPERVAHYFSKYFLEEFSQGQLSLAAAVRIARERLQWLESDGRQACPAATWLELTH